MKVKGCRIPIKLFFSCLAGFLLFGAQPAAADWQNEVTIYGWYAGLDGKVQAPRGMESDFTVEASDILDNLNMILMAGYEGRYEKFSVLLDFVYMDIGNDADIPTGAGKANVDLNVSSYLVNGGIGYELFRGDTGDIGVVGGVRYLSLDVDYDASVRGVPLISSSGSDSLTDGFVGLRGQIRFNDNWFLPYYADIGAGGSDLSYQLYAAIGYRFGWGDIRLGYRHVGFELGDDRVMEDLHLSGPLLGVGFRF